MLHNGGMRILLVSIFLIPVSLNTGCSDYNSKKIGAGRGVVYPPLVHEMAQIKCLATMVYGEARGEQKIGQIAVAYSAINRASSNKSLCDVVLAPKQYSIFNNNPALAAAAKSLHLQPGQKNIVDNKSWENAKEVAELVVKGKVPDPTNGSTHYIAPKIMNAKKYTYPKWTREYKVVAVIDNHRFYKQKERV